MTHLLTDPLFIILVGVVAVVGGIIGLKLHPFLALLLAAFLVAFLTPAAAVEQFALSKGSSAEAARQLANRTIGERIAAEFGSTAAKIGLLIAMAALIGKCMLESGAAERIVRSILRAIGIDRAPAAFLVSSFFIGIPVFFDTVIFLMMPLAKAISLRIGKNYLLFVLSVIAGAMMANSLVPPAPGPLFLVGAMQIPIGLMIVAGSILGIITATSGYLFARWLNRRMEVPVRDSQDARVEDIKALAEKGDDQLPSLSLSLLPVVFPVLFICADTFLNLSLKGAETGAAMRALSATVHFLGDKNTALVIAGLLAMAVVIRQKRRSGLDLSGFVQQALVSGGVIVLITCAGGAFGGIIQQTGISARIAGMTADYQMALIPLSFLVAAVVRTAQGSATVALITASGMLAGLAAQGGLSYHPLYLGLAIGCGAKLVPWMNDPGFWIICKMSNLTEKEALKTYAPMGAVMGLTGLLFIMAAAALLPFPA